MKEKEFKWDITISFKVLAENEDKAKKVIEEELEFLNQKLITEEIWFKISKED